MSKIKSDFLCDFSFDFLDYRVFEADKKLVEFEAAVGLSPDEFLKLYLSGIIKIDKLRPIKAALEYYPVETLIQISQLGNNNIKTLRWHFPWYKRLYYSLRWKIKPLRKRKNSFL